MLEKKIKFHGRALKVEITIGLLCVNHEIQKAMQSANVFLKRVDKQQTRYRNNTVSI